MGVDWDKFCFKYNKKEKIEIDDCEVCGSKAPMRLINEHGNYCDQICYKNDFHTLTNHSK